jgi:hypothetical protein
MPKIGMRDEKASTGVKDEGGREEGGRRMREVRGGTREEQERAEGGTREEQGIPGSEARQNRRWSYPISIRCRRTT